MASNNIHISYRLGDVYVSIRIINFLVNKHKIHSFQWELSRFILNTNCWLSVWNGVLNKYFWVVRAVGLASWSLCSFANWFSIIENQSVLIYSMNPRKQNLFVFLWNSFGRLLSPQFHQWRTFFRFRPGSWEGTQELWHGCKLPMLLITLAHQCSPGGLTTIVKQVVTSNFSPESKNIERGEKWF